MTVGILGLGLIAVWGCMIAHNMLLFALFLISYIKGTWNPLKDYKEAV